MSKNKLSSSEIKSITKLMKSLGVSKKSPVYFLIIILLIIFILVSGYFQNRNTNQNNSVESTPTSSIDSSKEYVVEKVVDGDTIDIDDNGMKRTIRYIGVNTPETVKPNSPIECFGKEASNYNKSLLENKKVVLEADISDTDVYGRLLRYVYLKDSDGKLTFVNKKLVEDGYAYATSYPPNVKYQEIFKAAEKAAREQKKGLWDKCPK